MENNFNSEELTAKISEVFVIDEITIGSRKQGFVARYRGMLKSEQSELLFDQVKQAVSGWGLLPILRPAEGRQELALIEAPSTRKGSSWVNLVFFVLTAISVLFAGALYTAETDPFTGAFSLQRFASFLWGGWPFAVSFLGILAAHEFGHYFMGRHHQVNVSLPYFIPFPFSMIGTMGAFINMKEPPRNKKHMLDIALAGPLSGLVVVIPVLILGLSLSRLEMIPAVIPQGMGFQVEGNSILYLALKYLRFGEWLPQPASYGGVAPNLYWLKYFFTGSPVPLGGMDVVIHPVAWAGWAGLLITMLNLIPAGQLDGGHIFHVLFGSKGSRVVLPIIIVILGGLGFFWNGWWLWVMMILFFGRRYAEPLDQVTPLDNKRKWLAGLALMIFLLIFMPVPLMVISG